MFRVVEIKRINSKNFKDNFERNNRENWILLDIEYILKFNFFDVNLI